MSPIRGRTALAVLLLVALIGACSSGGDSTPVPPPPPPAAAPTLSSVSPSSGTAGNAVNVMLAGTNFAAEATVQVSGSGVTVGPVNVQNGTAIATSFTIASTAAAGARDVTVTTSAGTSEPVTFTINAPEPVPTLTAITPNNGTAGDSVAVILTGTNFVAGSTAVAVAGTGITVGPVNVTSATSLSTTFAITSAATAGAHNVTVTTTHGTSGAVPFTVNAVQPSPNPWPVPAYKGATGKGVVIAILDRGIQWQHPDFINPDGTTRIKAMLDMSGQNFCDAGNPAPVEYTEAQINAALHGGASIPLRDAVGHGNVTAGIAAGNGRAAADGRFAGVAPDADLIIVKVTSDGAPAHDNQPAESAFTACYTQALDWLETKLDALGEPAAVLINSGVQLWGPTDGTSVMSQKLDQMFNNHPGRIYVSPSGDEGGLPTHAGGAYSSAATTVAITRSAVTGSQIAIWNSGAAPATVTITLDDGTTVGPVAPGGTATSNGVTVTQYLPGQEFFPATSSSGDHFTDIVMTGHATTGHITIQGQSATAGHFDMYSDAAAITAFHDHLVPGRLDDFSSTHAAIVVGASVNSNSWTDVDGVLRSSAGDIVGALWSGSSGGPTRDGRNGIDIVTSGEGVYAAYSTTSYWGSLRFDLVQGGNGYYGRQGATSGAAPIALGAVALMLQFDPTMTSDQARALIHTTATVDGNTGAVPNTSWGYGKINIPALIDRVTTSGRRAPPTRH